MDQTQEAKLALEEMNEDLCRTRRSTVIEGGRVLQPEEISRFAVQQVHLTNEKIGALVSGLTEVTWVAGGLAILTITGIEGQEWNTGDTLGRQSGAIAENFRKKIKQKELLLLLLLSQLFEESLSQYHPGIEIHVPVTETVQEGLCIFITCSFNYSQEYSNNDTAYGHWKKENKVVATTNISMNVHPQDQNRFHIIGDLQMNNCSLRITGVQKQDSGNYSFWLEKGNLTANSTYKMLFLQVEDLTMKPKINITDILEAGRQVTLICIAPGDCREGTPPNFLWTASALSSQGFDSSDLNSSKLLFTPKAQDHGTNLTCQVTFPDANVTTETTVQLSVAYPPRILGPFCFRVEEGLLCTCSVQGELRPSLQWWVGESIVDGNSSDNSSDDTIYVEYNNSTTGINSSLTLTKELDTDLSIRCEGKNLHGTQSGIVLILVPGKASSSPWKYLSWMIKGALCGIMSALLSACLAICLMKMPKRKSSKRNLEAATPETRTKHVSTVNPLAEHENPEKDSPLEHPPSPVLVSCSQTGEDQVHYASISFQTKKPQKTPKPEDTQTHYSELKF
ncbi:sialic acid-binding Ig-like lectin 14 [Dromiciops gliroides]|uniref:sialic acid-binding Ig-like lectin 14 n=1 Tax=Dromiciops gliroides TaxID=33562 RepID=UPI001CC7CECA|nr:sialic acid-binding Ig-like lectin 14 [Dromiciops gliroides]